nr:Gag-Pol polyprotein [Tanacetum cinerariifolium]
LRRPPTSRMKSLDSLKDSRRHLERHGNDSKKMLRACPHHEFSELTQTDTFYNGLNEQDQDFLNAAAGGNLLILKTQFQKFINSQFSLDDDDGGLMTRKYFLAYTRTEDKGFAIAALKKELRKLKGNGVNTKFAKPSILEKPISHPLRNQSVVRQPSTFKSKRLKSSKQWITSQVDAKKDLPKPVTTQYLPRKREDALQNLIMVNERQMQTTERKFDTGKALNASLVDKKSTGTQSRKHDTSSRSRNDAHADDADIRPIYDESQWLSFHQLVNETFVEAWLRLKEMLRTCYGHGLTKGTIIQRFYHGLDDPTQRISDARGIFLYNIPNEAFKILEDKHTESHSRTTSTKPRHELVYKPPSNQNENDKGDVLLIEEDEIEPIPAMPNLSPTMYNSPTVSPFAKDCTIHIPHTQKKVMVKRMLGCRNRLISQAYASILVARHITFALSDNSQQQDIKPTLNVQLTTEPKTPTTNVSAEENNTGQAEDAQFKPYEFINPFCIWVEEVVESSLPNIDNSNMHTFYQRHRFDYHWTRDHPLEQVRRNPSKPVQTRRRLFTDLEICMSRSPAWYDKLLTFLMSKGFTKVVDHAGCLDTRKITSGGIQFLGEKLVSWMSKKQDCTAMSTTEAKYVTLSASCAQVIWMRTHLKDYGFNYNKIPLYCDSQSTIAISCNPVQHSRTKHINVRYHFIKEQVERGIIELYFVRTEYQLADMFTKALSQDMSEYLVR